MKTAYIYIITDGQNNFKVGITKKDPLKRLSQLQTGHPHQLEIVNVFKVPEHLVFKLEREAHQKIQSYYPKRGEWFKNGSQWHINLLVDSICMDHLIDEIILQD